jgi:hypothetical protein
MIHVKGVIKKTFVYFGVYADLWSGKVSASGLKAKWTDIAGTPGTPGPFPNVTVNTVAIGRGNATYEIYQNRCCCFSHQ